MPSKKKAILDNVDAKASSKAMLQERLELEGFAASLRQIIDPAALLIMRELSLNVRRFQDIEAQTKIGASLLSSRLRRLEKDGIIERRVYSTHPPRYEYFATPKGKWLDEVLFAASNWNIKWDDQEGGPSLVVYDKVTGRRLSAFPQQGGKIPQKRNLKAQE